MLPFGSCPVIVWQGNTVTSVSDPIHKPQGWVSQGPFDAVILNKNSLPTDTNCFAKQSHGLLCVVEDVSKHQNVKAVVLIWYGSAIEHLYRHRRIGALENVDPKNRDVRSLIGNEASQMAITTADVEYFGIRRNKSDTPIAEHQNAPLMDVCPMNKFY